MNRIIITILLLVLSSDVMTQPSGISRKILPIINQPGFEHAMIGVAVMDLESGRWLFRHNAQRLMMPASNTKLYTTAAGLTLLGTDFRYQTRVYHTGTIKNGSLNGDLVIQGSGDPVIGGRFTDGDITRFFRDWADYLKSIGIHTIQGSIIGDDRIMDEMHLGRAWHWDYTTYWYAAEISALSFNDNCVDAEIIGTEPGMPAIINIQPHNTSYVNIINQTMTVHPDSGRRSEYDRPWKGNTIYIRNHVPAGDTIKYSLSVSNPARYFVHVLREVLEQNGISVIGSVMDVRSMPTPIDLNATTLLFVHESPTLDEIVYVINKRSQNLYAELLLKTIGIYFENPDGDPASFRMGLRSARKVFGEAGVDTTLIQLADGSGLSRVNLITPEMTIHLLRYMWEYPDTSIRNSFYRSLPRGNEQESTLRFMFSGGPAAETVAAKTGTIGYARALSGYMNDANGRPLAFSIMFNHQTVPGGRVNRMIEDILNSMAKD